MKTIKDILNTYNVSPLRYKKKNTAQKQMQECFDFLNLMKKWKDIVGERLAQRTLPQGIYRDQLVVITNHSAFSEQLSFMETMLIEKICATFPSLKNKLKRITFRYDSQKFEIQQKVLERSTIKTDIKQVLHPRSPQCIALRKQANELFNDIEDSDLKEQFISIYIQSAIDK